MVVATQLRDLATLNRELGLQAGLQNHSDLQYVGGPVWDWQRRDETHLLRWIFFPREPDGGVTGERFVAEGAAR